MKRLISLLLCVLLFCSITTAYADNSALNILGAQQNGDALDIILYAKSNSYFTADNLSVRLEETALPSKKLSSLSNSDYGTSWIVILEPAPSENVTNMSYTMVENLMKHLGAKDNLAVLNASTREMTSFVQDMPTIRGFVNEAAARAYDGGYVKLYDAISSALTTFKSDENLNPRKCLVIVSGCVDKESSCTFKELLQQSEESPVTTYTIGITRGLTDYSKAFETVRALSDNSPGGYAFSIENFSNTSGTEAASTILDNEKNNYVLTADCSGVKETLTGTLYVSLGELEASRPSVTVNSEGEPGPAPINNSVLDWVKEHMLVSVMGGVLFILLLVLLIVLIKRMRAASNLDMDSGGTVPVFDDDSEAGKTSVVRSKVSVELTKRNTGERFVGEIRDASIKAGLEAELRLAGDPAISRKHMEFIWQNGILYVQDINSSNGTYVNGERITGAVPLNQNDVIHAGESDFLVTWYSNS